MDFDELWPGGPRFLKNTDAFKIGTDAVLLSDFCTASGVRRAIDIGCGSGIIAALIAWNNPSVSFDAIEILPAVADAAAENMIANGLSDRVKVMHGDIRVHRDLFPAGAYDLVVSNPPYYVSGSGRSPSKEADKSAREETSCTLLDLCTAAAYLTRWGGKFALVHKPERLAECISILCSVGLEPKRLRFVQNTEISAPSLFMLESRRGGNPSLSIEAPLIMTSSEGGDSDEIRKIYHRR